MGCTLSLGGGGCAEWLTEYAVCPPVGDVRGAKVNRSTAQPLASCTSANQETKILMEIVAQIICHEKSIL